jgi:hypothetical protein
MNKFEDAEDGNFKSVRKQIKKMSDASRGIMEGRALGKMFSSVDIQGHGGVVLWRG